MSIVLDCPTKGAMRFGCAQAGCPACLDALLREHSGLVYWMVMHQAGRKTAYADLLQAGRIGLWRAILHYEVGRGAAFSSSYRAKTSTDREQCIVYPHRHPGLFTYIAPHRQIWGYSGVGIRGGWRWKSNGLWIAVG